MSLVPGDEIERYTVEGALGRGAMAEVYRVRHRTLRTRHALKVLLLSGERIRERLIQEGQVQASIRHPNVLAVTDVLDVRGSPGLLMELVEGPTLEDWMTLAKPTPAEAERVFAAILDGVAAAHALGLVHRDLKPANILMAPSPRGVVPKVADFGLAKVLAEGEGGGLHRTRSGSAMGTPAYMSPEQIRDAKRVDHRADIFSLGCILYELTTGARAFEGADILGVFNLVVAGRYPAVPHLPERVQRAIAGALEVDRLNRIPTCAVFAEVLAGTRTDWTELRLPEPPPDTEEVPLGGTLVPTPLEEAVARGGMPSGTWSDDDDDAPAAPAAPAPGDAGGLGLVAAAAAPRPAVPPPPPAEPAARPPSLATMSLAPEGEGAAATLLLPPRASPPERRRGWALPVGGALVLAAVAGFWLWRGAGATGSQAAPPEPVATVTTTKNVTSNVATAPSAPPPATAPPAAAVATAVTPTLPTPTAPETAKTAATTSRPPHAAPAAPPAPAPAATAPAAATGRLSVQSFPPGSVSVDGQAHGARFANLPLPVGPHRIEITGPDGKVARRTLTLTADALTSFCWDFAEDDICM